MPIQFPQIPERVRAYVYRLALAVSLVLVAYGVVSEGDADVWVRVLAAVLAVGPSALATANTSRKPDDAGQSILVVACVAAVVCFVLLLALDVITVR